MPKKIVSPLLPEQYTPEEYFILTHSISNLYSKLESSTDKFLLAFVYELKYSQDMAGEALDKSPRWVSERMTKIKEHLAKRYRINF